MFECNNCRALFEAPQKKNTNISMCPNCNDSDIEELMQCNCCGEWFNDDELIDTTEMINGGVGYCCEQCIEDGDMKEF